MKVKIFILRLVFILLLITLNANTGFSKQEIWASSYFFPEITDEEKLLAINLIKQQDEVREASIFQRDNILSLELIIEHSTSKSRAKELTRRLC